MIGMELLNLLYGNPMQGQMGGPNPSPMAPKPAAPPPPVQGRPMPGPPPTQGANVQGGPQPAAGGPPPGGAPNTPPPQSGPPSTSAQSPPDLMNLYMQLEQRNRSANEIDHGLAMMASAYAAPGTQGQIMHSADSFNQQDPGAQLNTLIQLQNMQRLQNMPAPGAGAGGGAGIDPTVWAMLPPDAKLKFLEQQGQASIDLSKQGAEEKQKDLIEAQQKAPAAIDQMTRMDALSNQIKSATEADGKTPVMQQITSSTLKQSAAQAMVHAATVDPKEGGGIGGDLWNRTFANVNLSAEEKAQVQNLIQLNGMVYSDAFNSTGSRRTQSEVSAIKSGMTQIMGFNQPYDNYSKQFDDFQNKVHVGMANTYGAAGRTDEIPDAIKWNTSDPGNPKPMVNSAYLPGGDQYSGRGGQWASAPPPKGAGNFDYAAIPSGTVYTAPDGTQRRKP